MPREGGLIKSEWLQLLTKANERAQALWSFILQSWDTANKAGELNDYSVCTTWGVYDEGNLYLLHVYRKRLTLSTALKRAVVELWTEVGNPRKLSDRGQGHRALR
jgi:phage terminase large subunit-like protein